MVKLVSGVFTAEELKLMEKVAEDITFRDVPYWLGDFQFHMYGGASRDAKLPGVFQAFAKKLAAFVPEQRFNVAFLQKYSKGTKVLEHRDPKNNEQMTIIAPFGTYTGAVNKIQNQELVVVPGNVLIQECTINGVQGSKHSVSEVLSGTRYTLILNTIR